MKRFDLPISTGQPTKKTGSDTVYLRDDEIDEICEGYHQNASKLRFLIGLGLKVHTKPNGRPLVGRKHFELVLGGDSLNTSDEPNWRIT